MPPGRAIWWYLALQLSGVAVLAWLAQRQLPFGAAWTQLRLGGGHPIVFKARADHALTGMARGRAGQAITELSELARDMTRTLGPDHAGTLSVRLVLLSLLGGQDLLPDRIAAMAALIGELRAALGPDHPETLSARCQLADWLAEAHESEKAQAAYETLFADSARALGPDHTLTLISRSSLAIMRHEVGEQAREAGLAELAAVVTDLERSLGAAHPRSANTRRLLASLQQ